MSSAYLAPNLDVLAGHYRLIRYDQRGGGRSTVVTDPARLSRNHHVEDVEAVMNLRRWMDEATSRQVAALAAARRGASNPVAACRAYWAVFIRGYMADPNDKGILGRMRGDVCDSPPEAIVNAGSSIRPRWARTGGTGARSSTEAVLRAIQAFVTAHPPSR